MIIQKAILEATAVKNFQYPVLGYPEIAFVGRSNSGKSTLINTLVNRKSLARTSSTPGKTRTINFYNINDKLLFVDLPGYGYARISKEEKKSWANMIEGYLNSREEIKLLVLLVDSRHEPTGDDKLMFNWIKSYNYNIITVATKIDKLSKSQGIKNLKMIRNELVMDEDDILIPFSSVTKSGKEELLKIFENCNA